MVGGHLTQVYCLLLIAVQCWQACSNMGNTGRLETTSEEDCQCLRSKELFDIIQDMIKRSGLRKLTVITEGTGLCGDLAHLESVLLVIACSNYQSINLLSARPTTLSTIIIDCDQQTSENIIFHYLSARTSGQMERRLILPVYNFIFTKKVDINSTLSVDLTANHFVTISRSHTKPSIKSYSRNKSCTVKSTCQPAIYTIWRVKGDGPREILGKYSDHSLGNTLLLRNHFHNFEGMQLKVTTSRYTPFTMGRNGNYYGFCLELLSTIATHLNFTYDIIYSVDRKFGIKKSNGKWNGMMGMMQRKEVDMIVAGLTITSHREEVVDFTAPFFEETSTVLVRANLTEQDDLWTYLFAPLQLNVWLAIAGSVLICGVIVKVIESLGTYVKHFHLSNGKSSQKLSISESIWLMFASYVKQGGEILPSAGSSQCTIAMFWFIAFLVGCLYAANLTASLAIVKQSPPFETLQQLADDKDYKILLNAGSVHRLLLEGSPSGIYAALWSKINKTRYISFQQSSNNAMKLMFKDDRGFRYAVMGDRTSLETKLYRDYPSKCDWAFIPETFFTSGLGVALPENSPYKESFDEAIMKVMENGLPRRWKQEHFLRSTCNFNKMGAQSEAKVINLDQIKIMLVIVGGGMVLSAIVFFLEILSAMSARVRSEGQSNKL